MDNFAFGDVDIQNYGNATDYHAFVGGNEIRDNEILGQDALFNPNDSDDNISDTSSGSDDDYNDDDDDYNYNYDDYDDDDDSSGEMKGGDVESSLGGSPKLLISGITGEPGDENKTHSTVGHDYDEFGFKSNLMEPVSPPASPTSALSLMEPVSPPASPTSASSLMDPVSPPASPTSASSLMDPVSLPTSPTNASSLMDPVSQPTSPTNASSLMDPVSQPTSPTNASSLMDTVSPKSAIGGLANTIEQDLFDFFDTFKLS
jgi:hypothetical protein